MQVEDIIDTGKTLKRVCETLATAGAASVKVVVLLNKAERRTEDIQADYCALDVSVSATRHRIASTRSMLQCAVILLQQRFFGSRAVLSIHYGPGGGSSS